jgi:hypothetical protein
VADIVPPQPGSFNMGNTKAMVLKMAQEILHNQYVEKKMKLHNEWALSAATLWKSQGRKLDYPDLPMYPSETDVVQAAEHLWKFLHTDITPETSHAPETSHVPDDTVTHVQEHQSEVFSEEEHTPQLMVVHMNQVDAASTSPNPVTQPEDAENTRLGLLPSWILRSNRA